MGGGGNKAHKTTTVVADAQSQQRVDQQLSEFFQEVSSQATPSADAFKSETSRLAPTPLRDLNSVIPESLPAESTAAAKNRASECTELAEMRDTVRESIDELLTSDFKPIGECILTCLDRVSEVLKGRDLLTHQESCKAAITAALTSVSARLEAKQSVDESADLQKALELVSTAQGVYDECKRKLNLHGDRDDDDDDDDDDDLIDATAMTCAAQSLKVALESAYGLLIAHIGLQRDQLTENATTVAASEQSLLVELESNKTLALSQHQSIEALKQNLLAEHAKLDSEEQARQEALRHEREKLQAAAAAQRMAQAKILEQIKQLMREWTNKEHSCKHLEAVVSWVQDQEAACAAAFTESCERLQKANTELEQQLLDQEALVSALEAERDMIHDVDRMANATVVTFSKTLAESMVHNQRKAKELLYDSRFEVCYRRKTNLELQRAQLNEKIQCLRQQRKASVAISDKVHADHLQKQINSLKEQLVAVDNELAANTSDMASLNADWEADWEPNLSAMREHFPEVSDTRAAIEVEIDTGLHALSEAMLAEQQRNNEERRRQQEARWAAVEEKRLRISQKMLTAS